MPLPSAHRRAGLLLVLTAIVLFASSGFAAASGPDGRLRGVLTDSISGLPVAGASVRIEASDLPWVFETTSDASGAYELVAPPHRYTLTASSAAHLRNVTPIGIGAGQIVWANLTLAPASARTARLQGFVTDAGSGAPVTTGQIAARPPWWAGSGSYENRSALNATGYFDMALVPGTYEITTEGVIGYAPYVDYPVSVSGGQRLWYNVSLTANPVDAWVNGTVRDAVTSAPIPFAEVVARVDGLLLPAVTANASGVYALPVPSGDVELSADALGYAPALTSVYVWAGSQAVRDLDLLPFSESVRGVVRDGLTRAPMAGILVTVAPIFLDGYADQATTNASGAYEVGVPDDYYTITAQAPGYTSGSTWVLFFSGGIAWANLTLWPIVSTVSGYVTDAVDGSPVPGLVVTAIDLRTSHMAYSTADASGFFTLSVPPSPAMTVWVYGQGAYAGNVAYVATTPYATTWVNLTVARLAAQILLNATDVLTGLPVAGANVIVAWYYGSDTGTTAANGTALLDAPVGVEVYVTVLASGYEYWTGALTPVAGANALAIALYPELPQDVRVRGYVTDTSSGLGMSSVPVEAVGFESRPPYDYTNSTGYYEISIVAAPQTIRVQEDGFTAGEAFVDPSPGEVLWVNLTLTPDASPPRVLAFTATPSTGVDEANPTAILANMNESSLDRADLSILMLHSASAGVGTFLNLGPLNASAMSVTHPAPESYGVSGSWDTRTRVGRLADAGAAVWWPFLSYGGPFLGIVNGYFDNATLSGPVAANAVFDTRDGRLRFVITGTEIVGPADQPAATFQPVSSGWRIDLTTAAVLGASLVNGPTLSLGSLSLAVSPSVPSGMYAAFLQLYDSAGGYTQAAVLLQTARDAVPPTANAGADRTVNEDTTVTFDGGASTDNVGIASYAWTFVDGSVQSLFGVAPSHVFATPGTYVITLTVADADGNVATDTFTVTVLDVTAPAVAVSAPSEGATVAGALTVTVDATDNVGVVRIELLVDGVSAGNDTAYPFSFVLSAGSLALGNHTLEVVAYDAAGYAASGVRNVTIVPSGGAPVGPDLVFLGGLLLFPILAGIVLFLFLLKRRRPSQPTGVPAESAAVRGSTGSPVDAAPGTEPAQLGDAHLPESDRKNG